MKLFFISPTLAAIVLMAAGLPMKSIAGEGHDHGEAPAAAAGPALPRFSAVSEQFELLGVVNGKLVTLYLDHAETNEPVKDAQLAVELGGTKIDVKPHADGEFEAELTEALKPGVIAVTATVTTAKDSDLLAGELDLHEADHAPAAHAHGWQEIAGWIAAAALGLSLLAWGGRLLFKRRSASPAMSSVRTGGAA
jgi:hypothetical protein